MPPDTPVSGHDGDLIRLARESMIPKLSIRRAAALTHDDPGNWGCIERGYQDLGGSRGRRIIMHPPAPVLARMSSVVGVAPAEWEVRGRGDVADLLDSILEESRRGAEAVRVALAGADEAFLLAIRSSRDLTAEQKAEWVRMWGQNRERVAELAADQARRLNGG